MARAESLFLASLARISAAIVRNAYITAAEHTAMRIQFKRRTCADRG